MSHYPERRSGREVDNEIPINCFPFLFFVRLDREYRLLSIKIELDLNFRDINRNIENLNLSDDLREFIIGFQREMKAYFNGKKPFPDLPHYLRTSEFSKRVLSELRSIPVGEVLTYGELAKRVGLEGGARAIGQILARNPLPLIYPCHRVVSEKGLGGYSQGKLIKYLLLLSERSSEF